MCGGLGVGWEREVWQTENYRDYDILKCCITNKQVYKLKKILQNLQKKLQKQHGSRLPWFEATLLALAASVLLHACLLIAHFLL